MHGFHDLVAGQGLPGFRDGAFADARFSHPQGLAQSEDGTCLYVADRDNHRLRTVWLDRDNEVETLCGSGQQGYQDDSCKRAMFSSPSQLLALPGGRLLVLDAGNHRFRMVDLKQGIVSTLMAVSDDGGGAAKPLELAEVWSVAYDATHNMLYYSEPGARRVRRYDLAARRVQDIIWAASGPINPAALGIQQDHLYVSDRLTPNVYWANLSAVTESPKLELQPLVPQGPLLAFADGPDSPVALRGTPPNWVQISPDAEVQVQMLTTEGELFSAQPEGQRDLLHVSSDQPPGFIADRRSERRYFYASSLTNSILSLAAYRFETFQNEGYSSGGLYDFEYSPRKPPNTFRILVIGDSRTFFFSPPHALNRMLSLPKQLELLLNTRSALENRGVQFEVLLAYRLIGDGLTLWPYYVVPHIVEKYDIDLVMTVAFPALFLNPYSERPITSEGLPAKELDPEFLLQKFESRVGPGVYRKFYDECGQKGLIKVLPNGREMLPDTGELLKDPHLRGTLVEMVAPGVQALSRKLAEIGRRRKQPVGMLLVYCPFVARDMSPSTDDFRDMWQRVIEGAGGDFVDLTAPIRALVPTYFPTSEERGGNHETRAGFSLLAEVLTHVLIDENRIPMPASGGAPRTYPSAPHTSGR